MANVLSWLFVEVSKYSRWVVKLFKSLERRSWKECDAPMEVLVDVESRVLVARRELESGGMEEREVR